MADGNPEKIDGRPGVMGTFTLGPVSGGLIVNAAVNTMPEKGDNPDQVWTVAETMGLSDLGEAQTYYEQDRESTKNLMNFTHLADRGFEGYSDSAKLHAKDYLVTDEDGAKTIADAAAFGNIAENIV